MSPFINIVKMLQNSAFIDVENEKDVNYWLGVFVFKL